MIARWHLLTGEYPPLRGGIAQFVAAMADALVARGADVHVWNASGGSREQSTQITVHHLDDQFGSRSRTALANGVRKAPGRVLLNYTPNALGSRGMNLPFCRWFAAQGRTTWDARVLFHEPFMYFGRQSIARNMLALVHRIMATSLLRTSDEVYLSTPSWQPLLERFAIGEHRWRWIPITAGTPPRPSVDEIARARSTFIPRGARWLLGTFGTYAAEIAGELRGALLATLAACPDAHVVCIGKNSREFAETLGTGSRVTATGEISEEVLSRTLAACDLLLQPFPEGVTCRRTSLLRALATGTPVVTTAGTYTEPIWQSNGAVALVAAGAPDAFAATVVALLADPVARLRLRKASLAMYDESFSPAASIEALDPRSPAACASCS